jgi:hypothetical protein
MIAMFVPWTMADSAFPKQTAQAELIAGDKVIATIKMKGQ